MTIDKFEELLALIGPTIKKQETMMRFAITSRVRLAITLRYIASGDSYRSLEYISYISRKTISKFVPEVLHAIVDSLELKYLKMPTSQNEWYAIAKVFEELWNFPHTLGAIDGKHIRIKSPPHLGSDFYNYKGFFSIVLLAVVGAHSRFIYIDVGANGRGSDVVVFKNSSLYQALMMGNLNIPPDEPLNGDYMKTSFYFIGNDIFGLDRNLMKAYSRNSTLNASHEVFNYRLSRALLTVEMAFGRLAARFRIFHRPIEIAIENCDILVKACCVFTFHNYISGVSGVNKNPTNVEEENPYPLPETFTPLPSQSHHQYKYASEIRDNIRKYCVMAGDIPDQWDKIKKQQLR